MDLGALLFAAALALTTCAPSPAPRSAAGVISFSDLLARPRQSADRRIAYGPAADQFADLWLPPSPGPHPVIVLIHGGCWQESLPGLELMDYLAADLRGRGFAVWNIEYRRIGSPGGGFPGTFTDTGAALDELGKIAAKGDLDLKRLVIVGHSAGGQLALWAAARARLPASSPLFAAHPLPAFGVVTLAGINDLEAYRATGGNACGGPPTIDALLGARERPYADTSPAALLPIGVRQIVVSGALDPIVPARFGRDFAKKAASAGDKVRQVVIPAAGHFELIDPGSAAWRAIIRLIETMARS